MDYDPQSPHHPATRSRRILPLTATFVAIVALGTAGTLIPSRQAPRVATIESDLAAQSTEQAANFAALASLETPPNPVPVLDSEGIDLLRSALRESIPPLAAAPPVAEEPPTTPFAQQEPASSPEPQSAESDRPVRSVPLPIARPPEFRNAIAIDATRRASRQAAPQVRTPATPVATEDDRSFIDKLFGVERPKSPALAYAALESGPIDTQARRPLSPAPAPPPVTSAPAPQAGGGIAVYDISARMVTMPNGEKLEAHSGIGPSMDDPRYVHLPMRGATPPGTYDLTQREELFHGVQALRLTPVGGSANIYGRAGILAHTYMRGPSGASNGCVSFRDYNRFLQAYLRGEVQRIVVVAGRGQDTLPSIVNRIFGTPTRSASAGN